jgi:MFS family permease
MVDSPAAGSAALPGIEERSPDKAPLVLLALISVAAVANLNLAVANVALPDIGKAFDASQSSLNLIAVGYSLGLAASVLWLGALGDRYGRKMMLIAGTALSVPACILAATAPSEQVLIVARLLGGIAAGMAYPTTLALITALWAGPGRTKSIALWSALGGAMSSLGPLVAGALLERFFWGSVFLVTLPLAVVALVLAMRFVPAHVNEATEPVDNLGGILSALLVGGRVLAIALAAGIGFVLRQRRVANPLYDLHVASRRIFWVAACAGIIVFGSLMGAMFIGQQYLQNVLGWDTLSAGAAILPAAVFMIIAAPRSAKLVEAKGARFTLLTGYSFCFVGFLSMLILWTDQANFGVVAVSYSLMGIGVGLAGTPASRSLTSSVPVSRAGMASGTADLQRDLGGAIMQSFLGAVLTAGYAKALSAMIASSPDAAKVSSSVQAELTKSFSSAEVTAKAYPQYSSEIVAAARQAFVEGQDKAYFAGLVAVVAGAALVWFMFPKLDDERELLRTYLAEDTATAPQQLPA